MKAEARQLALGANTRIGQPDLGHEAALRQHREDACVDAVGLAGERRESLCLLRVGDQDVEAEPLERVMDEACSGHRLDDSAHRLAVSRDAAVEVAQAV